ncbi:MAG: alpha-amylase family glycosyl hydrolase [Chloroflexota bacterium]|nr:alpha-amylase family glycosyl hydrolase [Chloroflexota bacterium]
MRDEWWQSGVIYQIYPRSFQDSNADGAGDLPGITSRLDYLSWLGVDAIWLNPIYISPMADFGYDVSDYTGIDPVFGTLADFDALLRQAHHRGLKVIVDFVPNHTSSQHPWFLESRSSRRNPRRDWYFWRDPAPDGGPPNNWISPFGGSQWALDPTTGQSYLHPFGVEQPDLNWRNPAVEAAMFDVVRFWLERGVDGFRIDVANFIMKDPDLRDNPPNPTAGSSSYKYLGWYDTQLHLNDKGHPDIHQVYRRLRTLLDSYGVDSDRVALGEIHLFEWPEWTRHWAAYYGSALDELHLPLSFTLMGLPWDARRFQSAINEVEAAVPDGAWPNLALGSHDEARVASRFGAARAGTAIMMLLTLRGTPIIYYGDELGMTNVTVPLDLAQDTWGKHDVALGRDPQRTPMHWDSSPNAGFCPADVASWLPVAPASDRPNVMVQMEDPRSVLSLTRELLALRRTNAALSRGSYTAIESGPEGCFAYVRAANGQRVMVALNFSADEQVVDLAETGETGQLLLSTFLDRQERVQLAHLRLRGNEGCVVTLNR